MKRIKRRPPYRAPAPQYQLVYTDDIDKQFADLGGPADVPVGSAFAQGGTVYADRGTDRYTLAHEIGHALDHLNLSDADRQRFYRIMMPKKYKRNPGRPWEGGTGTSGGHSSLSEWFADYYAAAATNLDLSRENASAYADLRPKRLRRFKRELRRVGLEDKLEPLRLP